MIELIKWNEAGRRRYEEVCIKNGIGRGGHLMEVSPEVELFPDKHQTPCHKCKAGDEVIYISVKYFEMMNKIREKTLETPWRISIMETSSDELPEVLAAKIEAIKERIERLNDEIADREAELTRAREERHALQMMVDRYEGNFWTKK